MEELVVTRYWMAGVMAIMLLYGGIALVGVLLETRRGGATSATDKKRTSGHA